jgi:hypothetical protein
MAQLGIGTLTPVPYENRETSRRRSGRLFAGIQVLDGNTPGPGLRRDDVQGKMYFPAFIQESVKLTHMGERRHPEDFSKTHELILHG